MNLPRIDFYSLWSYDQFCLKQHQLSIDGLYANGHKFYIVCPDIDDDEKALDGTPLTKWFANNKALTAPIELVREAPPDAKKISPRSVYELANLTGEPLTVNDVYHHLKMFLGSSFPDFWISDMDAAKTGKMTLVFDPKNKLSDEQTERLEKFNEKSQRFFHFEVAYGTLPKRSKTKINSSAKRLEIMMASSLPEKYPARIKYAIERDEDLWLSNREALFSPGADSEIESPWPKLPSRCFINASVFPTANVGLLMTMFDEVVVNMPIQGNLLDFLNHNQISEDDLIELVRFGKMRFVCPNILLQYSGRLLDRILDVGNDSIIFSRSLAALTVQDSRRRFPILYPTFDNEARYVLLHILREAANDLADKDFGRFLGTLATELSIIWSYQEAQIHAKGAMATPFLGLGQLTGAWFKAALGKDLFLEFFSAASAVEFSQALGCTLFPINSGSYSEAKHCEVLTSLYNRVNASKLPSYSNSLVDMATGILGISGEVPVMDIARNFVGPDVAGFRQTIGQLQHGITGTEEISESIANFNLMVKRYQGKRDLLGQVDLLGTLLTAGQAPAWVSLSLVAAKVGLYLLDKYCPIASANTQVLRDAFNSAITVERPEVVLVSRLKGKLD